VKSIVPKPMLASVPGPLQTLEALASDGWSFEPKIDGVRVIVKRRGDVVQLWTRTGRDVAAAFPEVVQSILSADRPRQFLLDGELECINPALPLSALTGRLNTTRPRAIMAAAMARPAWVQAFDALDDDLDLPRMRQVDRRTRLAATVEMLNVPAVQLVESGGMELFERTRRAGDEGVIAKDPRGYYMPGSRTRQWLKFKHRYTLTVIAVRMHATSSWALTGNGRPFRNITVALLRGSEPVLVGEVGTGFNDMEMRQLADILEDGGYAIVDVSVMGRTKDGLREPVFLGLRTDLNFDNCGIAQLSEIPLV